MVISTPEGIKWFRMRAQLGALKLEMAGLESRAGSYYAAIKREYDISGSKAEVYEQFSKMVEAARPS